MISWMRRKRGRRLEGFVYRVPAPGGDGEMWLARNVTGQIAHGRTREGAVERLKACVEALAAAKGMSPRQWRSAQKKTNHVHFLRRGELLQT